MQLNADTIFENRKKFVWIFLILFWIAHWIFAYIDDPSNQKYILNHSMGILFGFSISLILPFLNNRFNIYKLTLLRMAIFSMIYSILGAFLWVILNRTFAYLTIDLVERIIIVYNWRSFALSMWHFGYPFLAWSAIYFFFILWEEWGSQKIRSEQQETLWKNAQLELLRYQLNPHFLFNTLSSLRALIKVNPERAEEMITQISEFLRYSLTAGEHNEAPLSQELEIISNYLDIEKVRFGNKLSVEFQTDILSLEYPVPIFLIHPLVENAIKHGMNTSPLPLKIQVFAKVTDNVLTIDVINSGKWLPSENNQGTGLKNTRKRLENAYPGQHSLDIIKDDTKVHIKIQIHRSVKNNHG